MAQYLIWVRWNYGDFCHSFALASRITTKWIAPVPASFYFAGIPQIFPLSMPALFASGLVAIFFERSRSDRRSHGAGLISGFANLDHWTERVLALLVWSAAFFVYMLRISHTEVRYLLPLAIPVVIMSALGVTQIGRWLARRAMPFKVFGLLLAAAVAAVEFRSGLGQAHATVGSMRATPNRASRALYSRDMDASLIRFTRRTSSRSLRLIPNRHHGDAFKEPVVQAPSLVHGRPS